MDMQALDRALALVDGPQGPTLTLSAATLPGSSFDALLTAFNGGAPLVIAGATKAVAPALITVQGKASFQRVADLPVTGLFSLDSSGVPVAMLHFVLDTGAGSPSPWHFSTSFPDLPEFAPSGTTRNLLDRLAWSEAAFILATADGADSVTGKPVSAGLNLVAKAGPAGFLGIVEAALAPGANLVVHGTIRPPALGRPTPPLPADAYPWEPTQWAVPGISLAADLGIGLQFGAVTFGDTAARIYCPLSSAWLATNRSYAPVVAITGRLRFPKASNLAVDLAARVRPDANSLILSGRFSGFSLRSLADLADVAPNLLDSLPAELRPRIEALGQLSLLAVGVCLSGGLSGANVSYAMLKVGLPHLDWQVFPQLAVENLSAEFFVTSPFSANRSVTAILGGMLTVAGTPFEIFTQLPGFTVRADLPQGATLPLRSLFQTHLPELPAPPDLRIDSMQLFVTPGSSYYFSTMMADDPPWSLAVGPVGLTISDVELTLDKTQGQPASGSFAGALVLNDRLELSAAYDTPGEFSIRAELPDVKLADLVHLFDRLGLVLPTGFDLEFQQSYVLISNVSGALTFTAATLLQGLGLLAFTVQGQGNNCGVALGIALDSNSPSSLPGLSELHAVESFLGLENLMLVVSSLDNTGFQFPEMAQFNAPPIAQGKLALPSQASGLVRGLNFYAQFSTSKDRGLGALTKYLRIKADGSVGITLAVSLPSPTTSSKLFLSVNEDINRTTRITGELGVLMQGSDVAVFLAAHVVTRIENTPLTFVVTAMVLENGVLIAGSAQGTVRFGPVQLSNLGLVIGVDFEGIPSLGFAATIDVKNFDSAVAVFVDSTDPAKSMFAGAVSDVTLLDIAEVVAGQGSFSPDLKSALAGIGLKSLAAFDLQASVGAALDGRDLAAIASAFQQQGHTSLPAASDKILLVIATRGSVWYLTDLSTMTHYTLKKSGDRIAVALEPQIYFALQPTMIAGLQYPAGQHVEAEIDDLFIKARIKISIDLRNGIAADVSLAKIDPFSAHLFTVTDDAGTGGPMLSLATYAQPNVADPKLRDPHLLVSGKLSVLGLVSAGVYLSLARDGLHFEAAGHAGAAVDASVQGVVSTKDLGNSRVTGHASVRIDQTFDFGDLGSVPVNVQVSASLTAGLSDSHPAASVTGSFDFEGASFTLPPLSLAVTPDLLSRLDALLLDPVKSAIGTYLRDAGHWLDWVRRGVIRGVSGAVRIAEILARDFRLSFDQVADLLKGAGFGLSDIAAALKAAFPLDPVALGRVLLRLGFGMLDIAKTLRGLFGLSPGDLIGVLRNLGASITDILNILRQIVTSDPPQLVALLLSSGISPDDVARAMAAIFGYPPLVVATLLRNAGANAAAIAGVLKDVFGMAGDQAGRVLSALGLPGDQIAGALKNVFNWSVDQTAGFLKNALNFSSDAARSALNGAGYAAQQVASAISSAFQTVTHALNPSNW